MLQNEFFGVTDMEFEALAAKVLIVDDNEINRMAAEEILIPTKMQIDTASDGKQALRSLEPQKKSSKKNIYIYTLGLMSTSLSKNETVTHFSELGTAAVAQRIASFVILSNGLYSFKKQGL